jgi:uncharacterized membrane protein (DUF485 family)
MTDGPPVQSMSSAPADRRVTRCCCWHSVARGVRLMGVAFTTILVLSAAEMVFATPVAGAFGVSYSLPFVICFFVSECKKS